MEKLSLDEIIEEIAAIFTLAEIKKFAVYNEEIVAEIIKMVHDRGLFFVDEISKA